MGISIYGEIALDVLVSQNGDVCSRKGGAGLYAALSAAKVNQGVELLTIFSPEIDQYYLSVWKSMGVSLKYSKVDEYYNIPKYLVTGFENYSKKVSRPLNEIKYSNVYNPSIPSNAEAILIFPINHSMPEELCTRAKRKDKIVFLDPKPNEDSISDTKKLLKYVDVLLVNEEELFLLSPINDMYKSIELLLKEGPKYIIVKRGIKGCIVGQLQKEPIIIPSYKSNAVCTLGSGDVFDGALVSMFMETKDMEYSARFASCMAASFIEEFEIEYIPSRTMIENHMETREVFDYSSLKDIIVYLAGPFFSQQELFWVNYMHKVLEGRGFQVLSPSLENGIINSNTIPDERQSIFHSDLDLIHRSDVIVALLDGSDMGTSFEIGYSYSQGKPIIGLNTSEDRLNNMILYGCNYICRTVEELISEVYKYAKK